MSDCRFIMNIKGISVAFVPRIFFQRKLAEIFKEILRYEHKILEQICFRVNYYHKFQGNLSEILAHSKDAEKIGKLPFKDTSYAYDAYKVSKFFNDDLLWIKKYGDIDFKLKEPSICKDRLIGDENGVLLKLDANRHFIFLKDRLKFEDKKDLAVFRGAVYQEHRKSFLKAYANSKYCNLSNVEVIAGGGLTKKPLLKLPKNFSKNYLSKKAQMCYKFIISLEGNDVSSNLKWAMNSNSLVLAPKMRCETWFMEGLLKPNEHFVLVDNENLEQKVEYYLTHLNEAKEIIENAHTHIEQFLDQKKEFHIGILVLAKYFHTSKQLELPKEILTLLGI